MKWTNHVTGRTVAEMLADVASKPGESERAGMRGDAAATLNRRAVMASAALLSIGCTFVGATSGDEAVLVDGWLIRPSDIKWPNRA